MCLGAALNARVLRLVYGASDDQNRGIRDLIHPGYESALKQLQITSGAHADECQAMLQEFFKKVREEKP